MLNNLDKYNIVLGSGSPRRKELLAGLGLHFRVETVDVEETYPADLEGTEIPVFLAEKKSQAQSIDANTLLITADTIVWLGGKVLGKPTDQADAITMLKTLSGQTHQVISGVCVRTLDKTKIFSVVSEVSFAMLTEAEIEFYVEKYRPYDKAGAYGVQEWIGFVAVTHIEGSFYNIMGLPIQRLYTELKDF